MSRRPITDPLRRLRRVARHVATEHSLRRNGGLSGAAVAEGLGAARRDRFDAASRQWFERIEALRASLAASEALVEVVDYGAGLPSMSRSEDEMRAGSVSRASIARLSTTASLPESQGRLLHAVVRALGPTSALELGTCVGLSAAYQASAQAADGSFVTCEGAPELASTAAANLRDLGLDRARVVAGRFDDTVPGLAAELAPLDYVFVDGHHDEIATVRYFELLRPHAAPGAAFVFDDIRWSDGMKRAWRAIASSPAVMSAADLGRLGLVLIR